MSSHIINIFKKAIVANGDAFALSGYENICRFRKMIMSDYTQPTEPILTAMCGNSPKMWLV